jgi:hypothetical protein
VLFCNQVFVGKEAFETKSKNNRPPENLMAKFDFPAPSAGVSPETAELAMELQREKPDPHLIKWLINDREADLSSAMKQAHLEEKDLFKKPQLRLLCLQQYLHH